MAAENAKNEILGNGGTYTNPKDKSALKEIRDSRDAIKSIESNMSTAVEAAGQIDSFRSEIITYRNDTENARDDILSGGADGEKSVYEKIIDAETSIIGSGGTVAEPKEGSALKATKDAQAAAEAAKSAAVQARDEAEGFAASANKGITVINSLDSTDTANALSANQGRVLNEKIANLTDSSNEIYIMKSGETEADVPKSVEVIIMPEESGTPYVLTDSDKSEIASLASSLITIPSEYVTEDELNKKGYLTQHQDISGKVDKSKISLGIYTDGLIYLFVDGNPVGSGIEQAASGDVVGYVDSEKNIILSGSLADGTYTLKYEKEDGTSINIGELNLTSTPSYTNQIPISTAADGSIYNGIGYKTNTRLSMSSGNDSTKAGSETTGFIPLTSGDVIRIKGITFDVSTDEANQHYMILYDSNKSKIAVSTLGWFFTTKGEDEGNGVSKCNYLDGMLTTAEGTAYFRVCSSNIDENSIITINQAIE